MARSSPCPLRLAGFGALAASLFLGGCFLDRTPIRTFGSVAPLEFCPCYEVTASYDFLREESDCPADIDCTSYLPVVDVDSSPASFPPRRFTAYEGSITFVPAADSVDVNFRVDRASVVIPTDRSMDGMRVFVQRDLDETSNTVTVTRITQPVVNENIHGGMCAGATPVYATVELRPPGTSPRMQVDQFCNASSEPIFATLSDPSDRVDEQFAALAPGECIAPASELYSVASVRPQLPDPGVRCGAL